MALRATGCSALPQPDPSRPPARLLPVLAGWMQACPLVLPAAGLPNVAQHPNNTPAPGLFLLVLQLPAAGWPTGLRR